MPEFITRDEFQNLVLEVREIKDNHLFHIQASMDEGNERLSRLEGCYSTIKWMIGIGITAAGIVAGVIATLIATFL